MRESLEVRRPGRVQNGMMTRVAFLTGVVMIVGCLQAESALSSPQDPGEFLRKTLTISEINQVVAGGDTPSRWRPISNRPKTA